MTASEPPTFSPLSEPNSESARTAEPVPASMKQPVLSPVVGPSTELPTTTESLPSPPVETLEQADERLQAAALGGDAALKNVALMELRGAKSAEQQAAIGDAWWDVAETRQGEERNLLRLRAGFWYRQAEPQLAGGLAGIKIKRRLPEIEKLGREIPTATSEPTVPSKPVKPRSTDLRTRLFAEAVLLSGQDLKLDVYLPAGHDPAAGKRVPGIVAIHGGAWRGGDKKDMILVAAPLIGEGYVVFGVGYRLFGPGDRAKNIFPAQLDDCQRAVRWVRAHADQYGVDPQRIGAIGASAGGHLVALLGTCETRDNSDPELAKYSSRVQAVVDLFGPTDLTRDFSHLKFGLTTVQTLVDDFLGPDGKRNARAASPLFQIDKNTVPFLILHGDKDPIVPVDQSRDFHAALVKAGRDSTYIELPNEGYGFGQPGSLQKLLGATRAFFARHLRDSGKTTADHRNGPAVFLADDSQ